MRILLVIATVVIALLLVAGFALPGEVARRVETSLGGEGYAAEVGGVSIGWFEGRVTLRDLRIEDTSSGQALLQAPEVAVDVALGSLPFGTIHVESVQVPGATLDLTGDQAQRERWMQARRERFAEAPPVHVARVEAKGATVRLSAEQLGEDAVLAPTDLVATDLGNRPGAGKLPTTAHITATVEPGGLLRATFRTDPASDRPIFALDLQGTNLPLELVGQQLGLEVTGGRASLDLQASLREGAYEGEVQVDLENVELEEKGGFLGGLKAEVAEQGAGAAEGLGLLESESSFSGTIEDPDATLGSALRIVLKKALQEAAPA
ncbi:DUF748 domain-containing protein [Vulgatibacter sp.]|uniref:DUF748 domain-containing protein n=1 Tax=Vulgatibacter sp. TaxID=1971226 RepID=UPI0035619A7C